MSLDVVFGAMGGFAFACSVMNQEVVIPEIIILGLSVWIIYIIDHLLDSSREVTCESRKTGVFIKNKNLLTLILTLLIGINIFLITTHLDTNLIKPGIILGTVLMIYFSIQHFVSGTTRMFFPKELIIIIVYVVAIWFIPILRVGFFTREALFLLVIHLILVMLNVLLFSFFEKHDDIRNSRLSIFSQLPEREFRYIISAFSYIAFIAIVAFIVVFQTIQHVVVPLIINVLYLVEISKAQHPVIKQYYPEITDGAFLLFIVFMF